MAVGRPRIEMRSREPFGGWLVCVVQQVKGKQQVKWQMVALNKRELRRALNSAAFIRSQALMAKRK